MYTKYICKVEFDCAMTGDDVTANAIGKMKDYQRNREKAV
jgi:hypothetical protein